MHSGPVSVDGFSRLIESLGYRGVSVGILTASLLFVLGQFASNVFRSRGIKAKILHHAQRRKKEFEKLQESLKQSDGALVTPQQRSIRDLSFSDLRDQLQKGTLTASEVLDAYVACALLVTQSTNCVVDFIEEAKVTAKALDRLGPGKGGPLHGIPISVKENFSITGYDSTYGIGKRLDMPSPRDAALILVLMKLGAVPFCRTNIPQTMISFASGNPVYGLSENPYQKGRTCGGSSSGEGCLIGAGGSILGLGTDIGGSVRIPAAFSGCCALKPTNGRLSSIGIQEPLHGVCGLTPTAGFLARGVDALEMVYHAITRSALHTELDACLPVLTPIDVESILAGDENRAPVAKKKIVFGYCEEDGLFPPTPGYRRALRTVRSELEKKGFRFVPFSIPNGPEAFQIYTDVLLADGMKQVNAAMAGEPVDPSLKLTMLVSSIPFFVKKLLAPIISLASPKTSRLSTAGSRNSATLWDRVHDLRVYRSEFLAKWKDGEFDVLLCPAFALPAPPHAVCGFVLTAASYTSLFNLLDLPAGVVPVTRENEQDQDELDEYSVAGDRMHLDAKNGTKGAFGLPLAVQVAGFPWKEAEVLAAMREIEQVSNELSPGQFLHSRTPWKYPQEEI